MTKSILDGIYVVCDAYVSVCMRLHAPESWCVVYFPSTVKMYVLFLCVSGNNFIQIQKRMRRREREKKRYMHLLAQR